MHQSTIIFEQQIQQQAFLTFEFTSIHSYKIPSGVIAKARKTRAPFEMICGLATKYFLLFFLINHVLSWAFCALLDYLDLSHSDEPSKVHIETCAFWWQHLDMNVCQLDTNQSVTWCEVLNPVCWNALKELINNFLHPWQSHLSAVYSVIRFIYLWRLMTVRTLQVVNRTLAYGSCFHRFSRSLKLSFLLP